MNRIAAVSLISLCSVCLLSCGGGLGRGGSASGGCLFSTSMSTTASAMGVPGSGACGIDPYDYGVDGEIAVPSSLWDGSAVCGTCFEVTGPAGTARAVAYDECPTCTGVELSPGVASVLSVGGGATQNVTIKAVACDAAPEIVVVTTSGSTSSDPAFVISGARNPISSVAVGTTRLGRSNSNVFSGSLAAGMNPVTVSITDIFGETVDVASVHSDMAGSTFSGVQFSSCQ